MKKLLTILTITLVSFELSAQMLTLHVPQVTGSPGEMVELDITTEGFDEVISLQFSINWNQSIAAYDTYQMMTLDDAAIGEVDAAQGKLRFSWFDAEGQGVNLADGTTIMRLRYQVVGQIGAETNVAITGDPLEIQAYYNNNGNYEPITLLSNTGAVTVIEPVSVSVGAQTGDIACFGSNEGFIDLSLTIDEDYSLLWTGPNGFSSTDEDLNNLSGGDYLLNVLDINGDLLFDTTFTILEPLSALAIDQLETQLSNCGDADGSATVSINGGTPPYNFDWGNGITTQSDFQNLLPGFYELTITDANQCGLTDTFSINATPLPVLAIDSMIAFCDGEIAILEAGQFTDYQWSTGESSSTIEISEAGAYTVTVTNEFDCTATASTNATTQESVALTLENDVLETCPGESLQLLVSGGDQYLWIDTTGTFLDITIPDPIVAPERSSTYTVIGSNSCGNDTIDVEVFVFDVNAHVMSDTCIFKGQELQLIVQGGREYLWAPSEYPLNAYNIYNPKTEPESNTFYSVEILDNNDCLTHDTIFVEVISNPRESIPAINVLTPNGDGENDLLEFDEAIRKFGSNRLTVFNRWGDIVYERINYQLDNDRFDGTHKGKPLPAGTYYYVLSFRNEDIKQTLLIVR